MLTPSIEVSGPAADVPPNLYPTGSPCHALVVSADETLLGICRAVFGRDGWVLEHTPDPERVAKLMRRQDLALLLLDGRTTELPLPMILRRARQADPATILLVVQPESKDAVDSILRAGADDILPDLRHDGGSPSSSRLLGQRLSIAASAAEARRLHGELESARTSLDVQRAFFEQLFESAPEGIVVLDADDRILRANGEFCRMFGYTHPEILGRAINELIARSPFVEEAAELTARVRASEPVAIETIRSRRDGAPLEVSLLATPIHTPTGQAGTIAIYRDIRERKRAERALRASEERYRYLFERNPHPMLVYDQETLRFLAVNDTAVEQYGYSRDELLSMSMLDIRPPEDVDAVRKHLARGLPGVRLAGVWRHRRRDGTLIWVDVISHSIDFVGRPARLVLANDVTQRQAAEMRLQEQARELERVNRELQERTQELEHAIQARSRLYAAMSHELRTPISAIMLFNDLLLSDTLGKLSREQSEGVDNSQRAARHLLDLVNDVLDLAKVQAGKISIQATDVSLADFIEDLLVTARPLAASRGSTLIVRLPPQSCSLYTDARRLRQILLNLLSNAAKFGEGRPIELTCACECSAGGGAAVSVRDQGRGIAPEDHARIFDDFVQVGSQNEGGTGLGLPVAKRLTELLGGTLELVSELSRGSEFRLVLPARLPVRLSETLTETSSSEDR